LLNISQEGWWMLGSNSGKAWTYKKLGVIFFHCMQHLKPFAYFSAHTNVPYNVMPSPTEQNVVPCGPPPPYAQEPSRVPPLVVTQETHIVGQWKTRSETCICSPLSLSLLIHFEWTEAVSFAILSSCESRWLWSRDVTRPQTITLDNDVCFITFGCWRSWIKKHSVGKVYCLHLWLTQEMKKA